MPRLAKTVLAIPLVAGLVSTLIILFYGFGRAGNIDRLIWVLGLPAVVLLDGPFRLREHLPHILRSAVLLYAVIPALLNFLLLWLLLRLFLSLRKAR